MDSSDKPSRKRFSELVTCYVINLDSRPDRWERMRKMCRRHRIDAHRFSAHDQVAGKSAYPNSPLVPSELGLWSSFSAVIQLSVATEWILVLEDDALLLPGFRRQVIRHIARAAPEVMSIRLGWLGRLVWRPHVSVRRYFGRLPKRLISLILERLPRRVLPRLRPSPRSLFGTQAVLVRRCHAAQMLRFLGPAEVPLDRAMINEEVARPHEFTRAKRNLVWQWPSPSDIYPDRLKNSSPGSKPLR